MTTKDYWDITLNVIAMIGAAGAFLLGLYQWRKGQEWQRAAKGRELIDALLESDDSDEEYYAWDAMKMLDYQDEPNPFQTKRLFGRRQNVTRQIIQKAIGDEKSDKDEFIYVRECFDEFYFRLGQLQDAIDNDLVEFRHVSCPIDYYVGLMVKKPNDAKLHYSYMDKNKYQRALIFLENFPAWQSQRIAEGLPKVTVDRSSAARWGRIFTS
jgi:hypothetical protein